MAKVVRHVHDWVAEVAGIRQVDDVLWATSKCCSSKIYWRQDSSSNNLAYCSSCREDIANQPRIILMSKFTLEGSTDASEVQWWAEAWTGRNVDVTVIR